MTTKCPASSIIFQFTRAPAHSEQRDRPSKRRPYMVVGCSSYAFDVPHRFLHSISFTFLTPHCDNNNKKYKKCRVAQVGWRRIAHKFAVSLGPSNECENLSSKSNHSPSATHSNLRCLFSPQVRGVFSPLHALYEAKHALRVLRDRCELFGMQ